MYKVGYMGYEEYFEDRIRKTIIRMERIFRET